MLTQSHPIESLQLASIEAWRPYPRASERTSWEKLDKTVSKLLIKDGELALDYQWIPLLATRFLEYARIGNRTYYETENFARRNVLIALALAECAEGQGRFIDGIVNGIWLICEETYWGLPAHVAMQKAGVGLPDVAEPTVDLFAAETATALAYIRYLLQNQLDAVSPLICERIRYEIECRILIPNLERNDFGWMGFNSTSRPNNWNPWVNSNWLACVLFIESDAYRRKQALAKIMRSLDRFIDPYPADGGCDEGPGYWMRAAGSLFDCLDLLKQASDGQIDVSAESLIQEMGKFIYRAHIHDEYYLNFADASAINQPEASLVYRYGDYIKDPAMMAYGAWLAQKEKSAGILSGGWGSPIHSPMRRLRSIFSVDILATTSAYAPQLRDVYLPVIEVMMARDTEKSEHGFYVAAKGGHNAESHNHNDIGEFVVYIDGLPLLIDAGVESYSRKTFSPQRYEIWTMQSIYHNLPTINGVQQAPGEEFCASDVHYHADDQQVQFSLDISKAYPKSAGIHVWKRSVQLIRGQSIIVEDEFELQETASNLTLSLLTPSQCNLDAQGQLILTSQALPNGRQSASGVIEYEASQFMASVEEIAIEDARMMPIWGQSLYRILLTASDLSANGHWRIDVKRA